MSSRMLLGFLSWLLFAGGQMTIRAQWVQTAGPVGGRRLRIDGENRSGEMKTR